MDQIEDLLVRYKVPILVFVAVVLIVLSFFLGSKYALDNFSLKQVTPTQLASAMKDDHFWSSYREDSLIVTGKVSSVVHGGSSTVVSFETSSTYGVQCNFDNISHVPTVGQTITVTTIANAATRLQAGVGLSNCYLD